MYYQRAGDISAVWIWRARSRQGVLRVGSWRILRARMRPTRGLAEVIEDSVGDGLGEAVLEVGVFEQGGFSAVCQIAHLDQDGGAAGAGQDFVTGRLRPVAGQAGLRH